MEKEFIHYEQALALKGLGFDEPCLAFYWITGKFYITAEYHNYVGFHKQNQLGDYNYDSTSAPTFSQAFRWFREKYGLISYIHPFALLEDKGTWCYEITDFSNNWDESFNIHSPEEAEIECLKKLIEIVKEN